MSGFFTKKETQSISRPDGKTLTCYSCGLFQQVCSPRMKPYGRFKKRIMILGEAPLGEIEDKRGKQWQGKAGKLLQRTLRKLGIDLFEDCVSLNAINCRPVKDENNRTPTNFEIDCCRQQIVLKTVREYKPKVIIILGSSALYSIIGDRWKKKLEGIMKWRGWTIPDQEYKAWICPTFHPSYVMRGELEEVVTVWEQDLQRAIKTADKVFPVHREPRIHYCSSLRQLNNIKPGEARKIAFDYETTGLKPHKQEQQIVCASIAVSEDEAYTFMMPEKKEERLPFVKLLKNGFIKKMAHHMKFEENWTKEKLGFGVKNWYWDSMLAAHILDQRSGITSLKFQTYVQFGIMDYDSEIAPYLKAVDEKNSNSLNRVLELVSTKEGKKKLLKYCALDSVFEYRLAEIQMEEIL